jgi:hypothetical protein
MNDGSRHFAVLPENKPSAQLLIHTIKLWGAIPTAYLPSLIESWIDFRYKGYKFRINNQYGDYWFFAETPECPDAILLRVKQHFEELLCSPTKAG